MEMGQLSIIFGQMISNFTRLDLGPKYKVCYHRSKLNCICDRQLFFQMLLQTIDADLLKAATLHLEVYLKVLLEVAVDC